MPATAYLPIVADRYVACVRHIFLVGVNLAGADMRAQVRLGGDVPGVPLVDLRTVVNGNAEGLRLVGVEVDDAGVPTSHVELVINETTMEGLPYAGEIGDAVQLAWDWQVTIAGRKRRLAKGEFEITGDGVTGAEVAQVNRVSGSGRPRMPIVDVWNSALVTFGEDQVTIKIDGADLVAPFAKSAAASAATATARAADADADRAAAQLAAAAAAASGRYFPARAAGEAGSTVDQLFATKDGAGALLYYQRTAGGSIEVARTFTPDGVQTLRNKRFGGALDATTEGGVFSITNAATPFDGSGSVLNVHNDGATTSALRLVAQWEGSTASPLVNNDTILSATYTRTLSNSANTTWAASLSNNYNDIPYGVYDQGERFGGQGWAGSVGIPAAGGNPGWIHAGRLAKQTGLMGTAGFQGEGSAPTAVVDLATGVRGQLICDAAGATITLGIGVDSFADGGPSIIKKHVAYRARAELGTEDNLSFEGLAGRLYNADPIETSTVVKSPTYMLSAAELLDSEGGFHRLYRPGGQVAFAVGGGDNPSNIHNSKSHIFANASGAATYATVNMAGVDTTGVFSVGGAQIVGARGAAVANATGAGDVVAQLNTLLSRLRSHGLIAE